VGGVEKKGVPEGRLPPKKEELSRQLLQRKFLTLAGRTNIIGDVHRKTLRQKKKSSFMKREGLYWSSEGLVVGKRNCKNGCG